MVRKRAEPFVVGRAARFQGVRGGRVKAGAGRRGQPPVQGFAHECMCEGEALEAAGLLPNESESQGGHERLTHGLSVSLESGCQRNQVELATEHGRELQDLSGGRGKWLQAASQQLLDAGRETAQPVHLGARVVRNAQHAGQLEHEEGIPGRDLVDLAYQAVVVERTELAGE